MDARVLGHSKRRREKERAREKEWKRQKERRIKNQGKSWKAGKEMRSLIVRALARQHIHALSKKFDYLSGRCRRQSGGSQMLLARGELKDIVIPCRHTVLSLSNLPQYYTRLQSRHRRRHPHRRRRRENDSGRGGM